VLELSLGVPSDSSAPAYLASLVMAQPRESLLRNHHHCASQPNPPNDEQALTNIKVRKDIRAASSNHSPTFQRCLPTDSPLFADCAGVLLSASSSPRANPKRNALAE
jgi:hypothetical protein